MRKKLWTIFPLLIGLVLLTAGSTFTVYGENDNTIDVALFKLNLPDDWSYNPDDISDYEHSCSVKVFKGTDKDNSENNITIRATKEKSYAFRKHLLDSDIDLHDYKDGAIEKTILGGVDYMRITDNFKRTYYIYRHEPSGITYNITLSGEENDSSKNVFNNLDLKLEDRGNVEAPYPWDGTPYTPNLQSVTVGDYTITPEYIPFNVSQAGFEIMYHRFALSGDRMYHQLYNTLETYEYTGNSLNLLSSDIMNEKGNDLSADTNGKLYVSLSAKKGIVIKDEQTTTEHDISGNLTMHPSGAWGLAYSYSNDTEKIIFQDGTILKEPWILTSMDDDKARTGIFKQVSLIEIGNEHIMVYGCLVGDDAPYKIAVYDQDGNQQLLLGRDPSNDSASFGYITGVAETSNGYIATDGNARVLYFWSKDGTLLGKIQCSDIFGTSYPWLEDMKVADDGSAMLLMTQKREDESASELMVFRLTGF